MRPTISVIIPNLNMGRFLPEAIASVFRQSKSVSEILIVDAGSQDDSLAVVEELSAMHLGIRLLQTRAKNPSGVRNCGLAAASGDIIGFLDADDLWPADKLAIQLPRLLSSPSVGVVSGFVQYFDLLDPASLSPAAASRTETIFHVHLGAALFHRSVFEKIGFFNEQLRYSEDVDLLLRVRDDGIPMTIMRAKTLYYRRHDASMMSQTDPAKDRDFKTALFNSLIRRRKKGVFTPLPPFESLIEPVAELAAPAKGTQHAD